MDKEPHDNNTQQSTPEQQTVDEQVSKSSHLGGQDGSGIQNAQDAVTKPRKSKIRLLLGVVVLLIAGGVLYAVLSKDTEVQQSPAASEPTNQITQPTAASIQETGELDTVAYAFSENTGEQYTLFWRSLETGDRTESGLTTSYVSHYDTRGNIVVVAAASLEEDESSITSILYSDNGGRSYKSIFETEPQRVDGIGDQITSMQISHDGGSVVFGYLAPQSGNQVMETDFASGDTQMLFETASRGVFIEGYNPDSKQIIYSEGCYNCDGGSRDGYVFHQFDSGEKSTIVLSTESEYKSIYGVNESFTEVLVYTATIDQDQFEGLGVATKAPYIVSSVSLSDMSEETLMTIDSDIDTRFIAGYMSDGETPYYVLGKQLLSLKQPLQPSVVFESSRDILSVHTVSDTHVIAELGEFADFSLVNFERESSESTTILKGDEYTRIFGAATTLN